MVWVPATNGDQNLPIDNTKRRRRGADLGQRVVNPIQKCHRLRKAEVSPQALRVARLSSPETSHIAGLKSLAGVSE